MRKKITVIGAGNVGAAVAQYCLMKRLGDVVLIDVAEGTAKGKALDLTQASVLEGHGCKVMGTADYADTANSDVIIMTAGVARKPGMSRDDLLKTNIGIVTSCVTQAAAASPNALLIVVSNPVDVMCMTALKASGFAPNRIIGLSGMLDASRMRSFIAEIAGVPTESVVGITVGEHGDSMVPLPRLATIGGVPAPVLLNADQLESVRAQTTAGGAGVVALLGSSAYYGPGIATAAMAENLIRDTKAIIPCSAYLSGQYGGKDMFMCVPVRVGAKGVEAIYEVELNETEKASVAKSIASIRANLENADKLSA